MSKSVWMTRATDRDNSRYVWMHHLAPTPFYYDDDDPNALEWESGSRQTSFDASDFPEIKLGECVQYALVRVDNK